MNRFRCCVNVISGAPRAVLEECLTHLIVAQQTVCHQTGQEVAVLFVDNSGAASERWVKERYPQFSYISQPRPYGFATNANLALNTGADYVLLLNSDAFLRQDTLLLLLDALDCHPRWAAASANLRNPDGSAQGTAFDFPDLPGTMLALTGLRRTCFLHGCQNSVAAQDVEADWAPMTCLLIRHAAIEQTGLLDEGFNPGYGEDIDWCQRARRLGWRIGVRAAAHVTHLGGASFGALGPEQFALFVRHLCRYHRKHTPPLLARLITLAVGIGLIARSARLLLRGGWRYVGAQKSFLSLARIMLADAFGVSGQL